MGYFEQESAVIQVAENRWRGELCRGWRIGTAGHGGFVLAVAARALAEVLPHPDPLSINAFYFAPTDLGPLDCEVEVLRSGRGTSYGTARLFQNGELKLQATAAYSDLDALEGPSWIATPRPQWESWDECPQLPASRVMQEFRERVDLRIARGGELFQTREPTGRGEYCGWVAHADGSAPEPFGVLMFTDAFPPPAFDLVGLVGWVPTVELTVQMRARPAPGPLQSRVYSRFLTAGVLEEDGEFWDSEGTLVAISRQTAKVRLPPPAQ